MAWWGPDGLKNFLALTRPAEGQPGPVSPLGALPSAHCLHVGKAWQRGKQGPPPENRGPQTHRSHLGPAPRSIPLHGRLPVGWIPLNPGKVGASCISPAPFFWEQWNAASSLFKISLCTEEWTIIVIVFIKITHSYFLWVNSSQDWLQKGLEAQGTRAQQRPLLPPTGTQLLQPPRGLSRQRGMNINFLFLESTDFKLKLFAPKC